MAFYHRARLDFLTFHEMNEQSDVKVSRNVTQAVIHRERMTHTHTRTHATRERLSSDKKRCFIFFSLFRFLNSRRRGTKTRVWNKLALAAMRYIIQTG